MKHIPVIACLLPTLLLTLGGCAVNAASEQAEQGSYERIEVPGPSLAGNLTGDDSTRHVSIYLPPGYSQNSATRYPVLYLLHGYTRNDRFFFGMEENSYVNTAESMESAWANGAIDMIVVVPDAHTRYDGSMYSNSVTTGDWEGFIAKDLVEYIDSHYRTLAKRESRGLAGHSMGGYGVLRIGMHYPEVYSGIYSMSPCCLAPATNPSEELMAQAAEVDTDEELAATNRGVRTIMASAAAWSPNPQNPPMYYDLPIENGELNEDVLAMWIANAPLVTVHQHIPALKSFNAISMDIGNEDFGLEPGASAFSGILEQYGIDHEYEIYEGDHTNRVQDRLTNHVIPMFSELLQRPSS